MSQGLIVFTPVGAKRFTLRVTTANLCSKAVAAIRLSTVGTMIPSRANCSVKTAHRSAIARVIGRMRFSSKGRSSLSNHGAILGLCRRYCDQVRTVCIFLVMSQTSLLMFTWIATISPRSSG